MSKNYVYIDSSEDDGDNDIHRIYIFSNKKPFQKMGQNEMRDINCASLALASSIHCDVLFILECCCKYCYVCSDACGHTKRILMVQEFGEQPREWTRVVSGVSGYPLDMSAESTQERLLVTVRDKETATNCVKWYLDVYDRLAKGSQPERIELPKEMNKVIKVKELSNGNLVVAYKRCDLDDNNESRGLGKKENYLISQVTRRGIIVCSYPIPSTIQGCSLEFISDNMVAYSCGQDIYVLHYINNTYQQIDIKNDVNALCYVEQKQLLMVGQDSGFSLVTLEEKCLKNIPALPDPNRAQECGISRIPVQQSSIDQPSPEFGKFH